MADTSPRDTWKHAETRTAAVAPTTAKHCVQKTGSKTEKVPFPGTHTL